MTKHNINFIIAFVVIGYTYALDEKNYIHKKEHSLEAPYTYIDDIHDWEFREAALPFDNRIQLTSETYHMRGSIWNRIPIQSNDWFVEMTYTSYSSDTNIADGMAFWLVPSLPCKTGWHDSYGGPGPKFTGLMIAIDTYYANFAEKEALYRKIDESVIIVVNNEKPESYNISIEGHGIMSGRCIVQNRYRKTPETISTLEVQYKSNTLSIYHKQGTKQLERCIVIQNITLPSHGHFGVSAATGGHVGAFEIYSFKYYENPIHGSIIHHETSSAIVDKHVHGVVESYQRTITSLTVIVVLLLIVIIGTASVYLVKLQRDRKSSAAMFSFNGISNSYLIEREENGVLDV